MVSVVAASWAEQIGTHLPICLPGSSQGGERGAETLNRNEYYLFVSDDAKPAEVEAVSSWVSFECGFCNFKR